MKIIDVKVRVFTHMTNQMKDSDGHSHPGEPRRVRQALLTIVCR